VAGVAELLFARSLACRALTNFDLRCHLACGEHFWKKMCVVDDVTFLTPPPSRKEAAAIRPQLDGLGTM
jgi:hypothetical protein